MRLIVFHFGAVNWKILFHSSRKIQEIHIGISGRMEGNPLPISSVS